MPAFIFMYRKVISIDFDLLICVALFIFLYHPLSAKVYTIIIYCKRQLLIFLLQSCITSIIQLS